MKTCTACGRQLMGEEVLGEICWRCLDKASVLWPEIVAVSAKRPEIPPCSKCGKRVYSQACFIAHRYLGIGKAVVFGA